MRIRVFNARSKGGVVNERGLSSTASIVSWRSGWIISKTQDLLWLQGSVLIGLLLLAVFLSIPSLNSTNYSFAHPAVLVLLLWGVLLDGTHVWATYARTYFAADEQSKAGLPKSRAWLILVLGPVIAMADYSFFDPGPSIIGEAGALFRYFLAGAYIWAYYHLIRQHYGVMVLYNRKTGGAVHGNLDKWFLWIGSIYAFARFTLTDSYIASGLPHLFPANWFDSARLLLDVAFATSMLVLLVHWIRRQWGQRVQFGPKHMFLLIVVGFHLLVFGLLDNLLAITATLTIFHNLQYHRIVWQYEKGKGRRPMGSINLYIGLGLFFGLLWYGPRIMGVAAAQTDLIRNMLLGLGWGIAFHHYVVDSRIWKVRKRPEVGQTLDRGA